jgi:hypothetical protein
MYLDSQETRQKLPAALDPIPALPVLPPNNNNDDDDNNGNIRRPSVQDLVTEIHEQLQRCQQPNSNTSTTTMFDSIVIGGEGEPTLRLDDLVELVEKLKASTSESASSASSSLLIPPIRLTSNGLVADADTVVQTLVRSGITSVSVALMTADADQYDSLMSPVLLLVNDTENEKGGGAAHGRVCRFIQQAVQAGLEVEITGVDRTDVDKETTEALARSLKVSSPVRWRPYFA